MKRTSNLQTVPFECQCGTVHNTADGKLPVGWTTRHGETWCADCTRAGVPMRTLSRNRSSRRKCA
ncbi:hypothetical protein OVA07_14145 [Novosphingobium sp. SL115]|uniref:hypothetical protein n=1 Tax=Novosphingobium sp. SL115 TaxID=2995150 RepID=UPI0022766526|nr:hypothetical protein [Novosphingobium sp. SL115]MCY1672145.1 hypothetical protein [Novosphingobium sp. SL115]